MVFLAQILHPQGIFYQFQPVVDIIPNKVDLLMNLFGVNHTVRIVSKHSKLEGSPDIRQDSGELTSNNKFSLR